MFAFTAKEEPLEIDIAMNALTPLRVVPYQPLRILLRPYGLWADKGMGKEWITLKQHIRKLILEGKRGNHPDYIPFFELFGKERIVKLALEIKEEELEKEKDELSKKT